ncbi:MAG: hypothetical protein KF850_09765 [Labilithrix sp.]|nr:hypothetical protein [Labilithrix sp.]
MKLNELQAQAPCDATCNPATHCCFNPLGGGGGGIDAGIPGGGGLGGICLSN